MKTTNEILITYDAAKTIIRDARNFPVETGGILVGLFDGQITVIIAAGESGINSIHHAVQYTSDAKSDKKCLEKTRQKHGNKTIPVGYWHKHPGNLNYPSNGDCIQAKKLAEDWNDGKPIFMGIVNRYPCNRRMKTSLRLYSLNSDGNLIEHSWKLVKSNGKNLLAAINAMPGRPEINNAEFWRDKDFQFYQNPVGRQRIQNEIRQLKNAGWNVVTSREKNSGILIMDATDGKININFRFPPEYPLNHPTVIVNENPDYILASFYCWNSLSTLLDIATKIKEYHYGYHFLAEPMHTVH